MATENSKLRNRFFVIRHGESEANVQSILVSKPEIGINQYGLTETGKLQAKKAANTFKSMLSSEHNLNEKLILVSSDFKRTRETAEILHSCLNVKDPIRFEPALRERGLGDLVDYDFVHKMWSLDYADPTHTSYNVESLMHMVTRLSNIVQQLDNEYSDRIIIMVSHGDPCQCIYTVFKGLSPNEFRKGPDDMKNCDIRELKRDN